MRVLVTGARGQVGNCLVKQLQEKVTLLAVDRNDLDITDEQSVKKIVSEFKPKYIINAAAHTAVDKAEKEVEQSYLINRDGPKYLAEAALRVNATILHISTDYVFSGDKSGEYVEVDKVNPQCVYGNSKFAGEEEVIEANYRHIILRTAWVFCEHGNNFVKTIINLGKERKYLSIVDDQYGGPTYAGDIAKTLISMIMQLERDQNTKLYGIYHYSGFPYVSWFEFASLILEKSFESCIIENRPVLYAIKTDEYPTQAKRPANSKLSTKKISDNFEIPPSNWQFALKNLVNNLKTSNKDESN